jgi:hypothetical protein
MSEKNDVITEREVFQYIRNNPNCKKTEIVEALHTNSWQVSHKLSKLTRLGVLVESGNGKACCYRVTAEFENVEPNFKKESSHSVRYVPRHKRVIEVYKKMLTGEELDKIDAPDDIKATIRLFEKYKSRSARQIADITGLSAMLAADLRLLDRKKLRKYSKRQFARRPSVGWVIRQFAIGAPAHAIRMEVTDETIKKAVTFIKMANSGAQYYEISRVIGIRSNQLNPMLKVFKSKYAKQLKDFEPEIWLER